MEFINESKICEKYLKKYTLDEFQNNFDTLLDRVENGESFIITSESGNVIIMPYQLFNHDLDDEIVKIHTNHEDGS
jgi:prevent-host-death family protein